MKEIEATKKIMTHLYFILREEPQREGSFSSLQELHEKLDSRLQKLIKTDNNSSKLKTEILENFMMAVQWMRDKGIILYDSEDANSPLLVIKEKLIKNMAKL
ncbi:MAG: hypothetical protein DA329_11440 [Candidatus Nitrosocosmicus sp.]|nr:hypothetical protein [Candidatus Nitrosocosmicus sp.]GKS60913.1 hypothetical protein YTPLAS21_03710 [Candidatus Nitrosocosmicus sp.]